MTLREWLRVFDIGVKINLVTENYDFWFTTSLANGKFLSLDILSREIDIVCVTGDGCVIIDLKSKQEEA